MRFPENRHRSPAKRELIRAQKNRKGEPVAVDPPDDAARPRLKGWEDFGRDGPLR